MKSGVNLELRKICASVPAIPGSCFMTAPVIHILNNGKG
jgi:hypothetical protein